MAATATCSTRVSTVLAATVRRLDQYRRCPSVVSAVSRPGCHDSTVDVSGWSRRGALCSMVGTAAWARSPRPALAEPSAEGVGKPLRVLKEYRTALDGAVSELDAVCAELRAAAGSTSSVDEFDVPAYAAPLDADHARASFFRSLP